MWTRRARKSRGKSLKGKNMKSHCRGGLLASRARGGKSNTRTVVLLVCLAIVSAAAGSVIYYFARDLDELCVIEEGKYYRSAQPQGRDYRVLRRLGIQKVISFRGYARVPGLLAEEQAACQAAGAEFVNIHISAHLPTEEHLEQFMTEVLTAKGPVLGHCEHGKTRAAMMAATYRVMIQGWAVDHAVETEMYSRKPGMNAQKVKDVAELVRRFKQSHPDMVQVARASAH